MTQKIRATMGICVVTDVDGRPDGYQVIVFPAGGGGLPIGPVCSTRAEAATYMDMRTVPARAENGVSIPALEFECVP